MDKLKPLWEGRKRLLHNHKLIHCITNPISMNDCANAVLALGAKPIMAQHPKECEEITQQAEVLALNLGNFDEIRSQAMLLSAKTAKAQGIPMILDLVGVACSALRLQFAKEIITLGNPAIVKGNLSEIKAIAGRTSHAKGIDVGEEEQESMAEKVKWLMESARHLHATILCSGEWDFITDGNHCTAVQNGVEMLTLCTGTGCMLNVVTACFLSELDAYAAAVMGCFYQGIAAQKSYERTQVPGSFHVELMNWLYALSEEDFYKMARWKEVK